MRIIKTFLALVLVCTAIFAVVYSLATNGVISLGEAGELFTHPLGHSPAPAQAPESTCRPLDLKALRARAHTDRQYLDAVEEKALSVYDAKNPTSSAWYADGRMAVELYVCRTVGNDFYGEGLLQNAKAYASEAYKKGCRDPLILTICDVYRFQNRTSIKLAGAKTQFENCQRLAGSDYPAICKIDAATLGLKNVIGFSGKDARPNWKEDLSPALDYAKYYWDIAFDALAKLIRESPNRVVALVVYRLIDFVDGSPEAMEEIHKRLDTTLVAAGAPGNLQAECMGDFLTSWAWTARGNGWAKSVTPEGWQLMNERLSAAQTILEKAQDKFPEDPKIPIELLSVELGQGMGKYRMERLFDKAVALDPGNRSAYSRKMLYLQPRWYGSPKEVFEFGVACINTGRWSDNIPLVFVDGVDRIADQDESLYSNKAVWEAVDGVYRKYLELYPESIFHRTKYLIWAVKSKQWDVAREQKNILGANWDRSATDDKEYLSLTQSIPAASSATAPPPKLASAPTPTSTPTPAPTPPPARKVTLKTRKTIYPDSGGTRDIDPGTELKVLAASTGLMTVELNGQTFNISKSEIVEQP